MWARILLPEVRKNGCRRRVCGRRFSVLDKIPSQIQNMRDLVEVSDNDCKDQLRMDRATFHKLCHLLQSVGGLSSSRNVTVAKKVAMCVLRLHNVFLVTPQPILDDSIYERWGKFKIRPPNGRYRETISHRTCGMTGLIIMEEMSDNAMLEFFLMGPCEYPVGLAPERVRQVRGRRSWSRIEEDALIHCLTDVVNDGWKAENGFRAGFQRELERGMNRKFPGTDIVATPHINSKIHVWKKEYGTLSDLLSKSEIGWNSTTFMIDVEDESVWEGCRRAYPSLKGFRHKTWPYYTQWIEIFGKDRATGENAVDPIDLANEMGRTELEGEGETAEKYVPLSPGGFPDLEDNNICKLNVSVGKMASKGKK
ncbi:hypothetical protein ACS0TY_028979 [Phlomoides rotata]